MGSSVGLHRVDAQDAAARRTHVVHYLARLDPNNSDWELELSPVVAMVVDALLHADAATLDQLAEPLRHAHVDLFDGDGHAREMGGYVAALLGAVDMALERLPDPGEFVLSEDSQARQMLEALASDHPLSSKELKDRLHTQDSQISRVGRTLLAAGLVVQRRAGREAIWEIAPRGRELLRRDGDHRGRQAR